MARFGVWLGHRTVLLAALAVAGFALEVLAGEPASPPRLELPRIFPFAVMSVSVDGLSAFFLLALALVSASVAIYGPSYLGARAGGIQTAALAAFVASMGLVCCVGDAITFLLAWEGMTLASYVLVVCETSNEESTRAGLLYLVMAHAGTAAILVVFLVLADRAQGFDFDSLRAAAQGLDPDSGTALFFLALAGFGAKAGVVLAMQQHDLKRLLAFHSVENVGVILIGVPLVNKSFELCYSCTDR